MEDPIKNKFEELMSKWAKLDESKSLSAKKIVSEYESTADLSNILKSFDDSFCAALKDEQSIALSNCISAAYEKAFGLLNDTERAALKQYISLPSNAENQCIRLTYLFSRCAVECING